MSMIKSPHMKMRNLLFILSILFILFVGNALADIGPVDNSNYIPSSTVNEPATGYADLYIYNSQDVLIGRSEAGVLTQPIIAGETIQARTNFASGRLTLNFYWLNNPMGSTSLRYFQDTPFYVVPGSSPYRSQSSYTFNTPGNYMAVLQYFFNCRTHTKVVQLQVVPPYSLNLTKTASPTTYTNVGNTITYTYTVTNTGTVPINGPITVSDNKINGGVPFQISASNLAVGTNVQGTATYSITSADITAGSVMNSAIAHGIYNSATIDSNTATATVTLTPQPALSITKTASPDTYDMNGEQITYTYTVTNTGNVPITAPITISDNKINGGAPFTISSTNLAIGANVTGTSTYTITPADITARSVINTATAHGTYNSAPLFSYPATATIRATAPPTMNVSKTPVEETFENVGDIITYEYVAWNLGGATLPGPIVVNDDKIGPINMSSTGPLPPETQITGTGQYTITEADVAAGFVTNTVTASGDYKGTTFSAQESATVYLNPVPELSITKKASPTTYTSEGKYILYEYNVTNTGNVPINGTITISDDKINNGERLQLWYAPPLEVGETVYMNYGYQITATDVTNGSVTNTAIAYTTYDGDEISSSPVNATVTYLEPYIDLVFQDANNNNTTTFGPGDLVNAIFTTNDGTIPQVAFEWTSTNGIEFIDYIQVNSNGTFVSPNYPETPGEWRVCVYDATPRLVADPERTPIICGNFTVIEALPEFSQLVVPLLLIGAVYVFMRRKIE